MNVQRIRVPLGFLYAAAYLYWSDPGPVWLATGLGIAVVGLGIRFWASGHLEKWKGLAVAGPYQQTRNPLYLGSLILGTGLALASARIGLMLAFVVLFLLVYIPVMRREERELESAYGEEFELYRKQVPLLFPWPGRSAKSHSGSHFRWDRFLANREYKATLGLLGMALFLFVKMVWT